MQLSGGRFRGVSSKSMGGGFQNNGIAMWGGDVMGAYIFEDMYKRVQEIVRQREGLPPLEQTKRRVGWFHWSVLFLGIILIVYSQSHDTVAVEVPVYDAVTLQRLQQENDLLSRKVSDYKALSANLAGRLKEANGRLAKLEEERNVLAHSSIPPQPVILEVVRKEAATEKGLRQVVARNFGSDIAKRVRVTND